MDSQPVRSGFFRFSFRTRCLLLVLMSWIGAAVYALADNASLVQQLAQVPVAAGMIGFVFLHGLHRYGARTLFVFTALIFAIAWVYEMLSIVTGFPFGSYVYTDTMRPFIGHVPVIVLPVYWVMGYVCWSLAHILLGRFELVPDRQHMICLPVVAAFLMVTWDLSMDPLRSTLEMRWTWVETGTHFGVPASNFFGWFLVTWTMFQVFAVSLRSSFSGPGEEYRSKSPILVTAHGAEQGDGASFWIAVPLMYLTFALEHILRPFAADEPDTIMMINGSPEMLVDFVTEIAWLTAATMVPIAGIAILMLVRRFSPAMASESA